VFQGEREMAADNKLLGQFDLVGIPSAPRGMPQIEVTFDIDANGIVNVSAKDKATNKEQQIRIQASGGLSDDEINKMVKDAEANASADKEKRALIESRNKAESLVHEAEKNLKEHGSLVSEDEKSAIEADITALRDVLESGNKAEIDSKTEALTQSVMKLGEAIYKAQASAAPGDATASGSAGDAGAESTNAADGEVLDAQFEDVSDDEKK